MKNISDINYKEIEKLSCVLNFDKQSFSGIFKDVANNYYNHHSYSMSGIKPRLTKKRLFKELQRCEEYPSLTACFNIESGYTGDARIKGSNVLVSEILEYYEALLACSNDKLDKKYLLHISNDLKLSMAYASHYMPQSIIYKRNGFGSSNHFIIDENLSYHIVAENLNPNARLSHINIRQMKGCDDELIWQLAKDENINAVITNDADFIWQSNVEVIKQMAEKKLGEVIKFNEFPLVVLVSAATKNAYSKNLSAYSKLLPNIIRHANNNARDYGAVYANNDKVIPIKISANSYQFMAENPDYLAQKSKQALTGIQLLEEKRTGHLTLDIMQHAMNWKTGYTPMLNSFHYNSNIEKFFRYDEDKERLFFQKPNQLVIY
jgi:hypothetical protein